MADDDYPEELNEVFKSFDSSLRNVVQVMKPLLETERSEMVRKLPSLDVAKLDLVTAYAVNSLFWGFLLIQGTNPKVHPVKQELDRIRGYMTKIKDLEEQKNAPRLAKDAAKRFVKHAMFEHSQTKNGQEDEVEDSPPKTTEETPVTTPVKNKKHKRPKKSNSEKKKKKRKIDNV